MQVLNTKLNKFIPMNIIVTYIEYVIVLEAIKTQKRTFLTWLARGPTWVHITEHFWQSER